MSFSGNEPSLRAVCRILNQSSCGSGSICGHDDSGRAYILTNAHVAGTRVGRQVQIDVEQTSQRITGRVIMAAYSDRTLSDWAILLTNEPYTQIEPVKLSKNRPSGSHYTKGFPRCRAHNGTDITTVDTSQNSPLWRWNPNAIGGQSGSGVWSDTDHLCYGLLTWSWGGYGAGQMTSEIYRQARGRTNAGFPRVPDLIELPEDYDLSGLNMLNVNDDPTVENGFFFEANIAQLPIWAEDTPVDPDPDPSSDAFRKAQIEWHRKQAEAHEDQVLILQGIKPPSQGGSIGGDTDGGGTFGL